MATKCGWCITNSHSGCRYKIEYFDKVWLCSCLECHPEIETEKTSDEEVPSED